MKLPVRFVRFIIAIAQSVEGGMAQHLELVHPYIKINSSGLVVRKICLLTNHLKMLQSFSVKPAAHHSLALIQNKPDVLGIPLGGIEGIPEVTVEANIFVGSKASWFKITDSVPQFKASRPGSEEAVRKTNN